MKCDLFLFPKQCLHYGVLAEHKGLVDVGGLPAPWPASKMIKKPSVFKLFQYKNGAGVRVLRSHAPVFDECFS